MGSGQKNWPIAFPIKTGIKLTARFTVGAATRKFLKEEIEPFSTVPIVGKMILGTTTLTFKRTLTIKEIEEQLAEPGHENYIEMKEVESVLPVPEEVRVYEIGTKNVASISWAWTVKSKVGTFEQSLGVSEHNLYATKSAPAEKEGVAIPVYLTLLDADTQGIEKEAKAQPPSEAEAFKGVWSEFKTRAMGVRYYKVSNGKINRGGKVLTYYEETGTVGKNLKEYLEKITPNSCEGTDTAELLEKGQGQCHAWAEALAFAFAYEGLSSEVLEVLSKFAEPAECGTAGTCPFLVKEWEFTGVENPGPFPFNAVQIKDLEGTAGQGIKNPQSVFRNHFIVEAKKASKTLYDPSYALGPYEGAESLKGYQGGAMAGFCAPIVLRNTKCQQAPAALQLATFPRAEGYE